MFARDFCLLTLLDAVLVGLAVVVNLLGHALNALVVVVLGRVAFLRLGALCSGDC